MLSTINSSRVSSVRSGTCIRTRMGRKGKKTDMVVRNNRLKEGVRGRNKFLVITSVVVTMDMLLSNRERTRKVIKSTRLNTTLSKYIYY